MTDETPATVPGTPAKNDVEPSAQLWRETLHRPGLSPARLDLFEIADTAETYLLAWALDGGGAALIESTERV